MYASFQIRAIALLLSIFVTPIHATLVEETPRFSPPCQSALVAVEPFTVTRLQLPSLANGGFSLLSVIPDFDAQRDFVIGISPGKHTYLVNAQFGRYDPGIYGGRGRVHLNQQIGRLQVHSGLIIHLRVSPETIRRMAKELRRAAGRPNLTCTNTVARILGRSGMPGQHALIFTPTQLLRNSESFQKQNANFYLLNVNATTLPEFEDQVKIVGGQNPDRNPRRRRDRSKDSRCCEGSSDASPNSYFMDLESSDSTGSGHPDCCRGCEHHGCESGHLDCTGSDCGGSDSGDSDCNCCG